MRERGRKKEIWPREDKLFDAIVDFGAITIGDLLSVRVSLDWEIRLKGE